MIALANIWCRERDLDYVSEETDEQRCLLQNQCAVEQANQMKCGVYKRNR